MTIVALTESNRLQWNAFVAENFPPVGAFLQSWEWGNFKQGLHGKVVRYAMTESSENKKKHGTESWIGCFQLELHALPLGLRYGYAPRGPVLRNDLWNDREKVNAVFSDISAYLKAHFADLIFVRFEPPHKNHFAAYDTKPFYNLRYYLQPRFNQLLRVTAKQDPEDVLKGMSADIRHDIRAAERLGVTVEDVATLNAEDAAAFERMKVETRARSGRNIFPSNGYFTQFLASFKHDSNSIGTTAEPYIRYFIARKDGVAVAINLNIIFSNTLTYLYGASYSGAASKRAPAYLHWMTMQYAVDHGLKYYDLGGVDDASSAWQGLSYFKKQFGGETLEYVGTVNAIMRPALYSLYIGAKKAAGYLCTAWRVPAKR